jgi:hypothetical protein
MPEKKSTSTSASTTVSDTGPGGSQLGRASYRAEQARDTVIIFAMGWHPTPGYVDFFEQSLIDIFPPQFILRTIPPTGIVLPVVTPFAIWVMFGASEPVETVTVHDADGAHEIKVEQMDEAQTKQRGTWVRGSVMRSAGEGSERMAARAMSEQPTTMAVGEEGSGGPTTMATGEEDVTAPTTMAVGEEGPGPTTMAVGEEETRLATTFALGEEGPGPTTFAFGEESAATTLRVGEEGFTTQAIGEEGQTTTATGMNLTTFAVGEETATTLALGEEGPTTAPLGEEGITTFAIGEETGGGIQIQRNNPFGGF